jgi:ElaB/YqjD/DUF883 family membrane-anchored ribosome-binding protein
MVNTPFLLWSKNMTATPAEQRQRLMDDLRAVIADAEELLSLSKDQAGEGAARLRERVQERLIRARSHLADFQDGAFERVKAAGVAADDFVHDKPWPSIGLAAGIGLLVGLLIGRR